MATLQVDTLAFHFDPAIDATKYDESAHHKSLQPQPRAVDVTAVEWGNHPERSWLIEAKDYRNLNGLPKDFTPSEIADDLIRKVNGTLVGLQDAAAHAADAAEKSHAERMLAAAGRQIVFHLEPYSGIRTSLFPDPTASVFQKLKQLSESPVLVLKIANTARAGVPWTVS